MKVLKATTLFLLFIGAFALLQISPLAKHSIVIETEAPLTDQQRSCLEKYGTLDRDELAEQMPESAVLDFCSPLYPCPAVLAKYEYRGFPFTNREVSPPGIETFSCTGSDYIAEPATYVLNFVVLGSVTIAIAITVRRLRS